jgi:hypothetical protein
MFLPVAAHSQIKMASLMVCSAKQIGKPEVDRWCVKPLAMSQAYLISQVNIVETNLCIIGMPV